MAEQRSDDVCNFFRKPSNKNRANIRKRRTSNFESDSESDPDQQAHLKPAKKTLTLAPNTSSKSNLIFASTSSSSKSKRESEPEPDKLFHFESSNQIQTNDDSRATATLETETDFFRDARAIRERVLSQSRQTIAGSSKPESDKSGKNLYKGIHGYTDYKAGFRREQTIAGEKAGGAHGPLRASAHIRTTARFDYQPDICKDYKETGYCGFGDACKFMHDRGDYKSGWQMEKEWEEKEKVRKRAIAMGEGGDDGDGGGGGGDDEDNEDELPFACFICRKPFEDPVVTKCKHYFCEHCALKPEKKPLELLSNLQLPKKKKLVKIEKKEGREEKRSTRKASTRNIQQASYKHSKNKKCFVCNEPTLGIFNTAHEIRKKMAQEKQ